MHIHLFFTSLQFVGVNERFGVRWVDCVNELLSFQICVNESAYDAQFGQAEPDANELRTIFDEYGHAVAFF